jgi:hypothetical protein
MDKLSKTASEAVTDFAQRVCMSMLTEGHRNKLAPAGKALGVTLRTVFFDERFELCPGKVMQQLTKETGYPYHNLVLLFRYGMFCAKDDNTITTGGLNF